jgi:TonB family protein
VGEQFTIQATPRVIEQVAPEYPRGFCGRGPKRAVVKVLALVRTDGTVENVRVIRSIPMLDGAAIACVKKWKFVPGHTEYGQALNVWTPVDVRWDCDRRR